MSTQQPEALRLADTTPSLRGGDWGDRAAAELRRLYALNAEMLAALKCIRPIECHMVGHTKGEFHSHDEPCPVVRRIEDTIAKAEGSEA